MNGVVYIDQILDSDNLNECVNIILSKERTITSTLASVLNEVALSASPKVRYEQQPNSFMEIPSVVKDQITHFLET
jgi:hypothetical protein